MVFKNLFFLATFFFAQNAHSQSYTAIIIKSSPTTYTVPAGYNLKIESIGYSCSFESHTDQITIAGEIIKLRQHLRQISGGTNSQSESVWEIKTPFWVPSGTVIELNNHASLQLYGLLVPTP